MSVVGPSFALMRAVHPIPDMFITGLAIVTKTCRISGSHDSTDLLFISIAVGCISWLLASRVIHSGASMPELISE